MRHAILAVTTALLTATTAACGGGSSQSTGESAAGTTGGVAASPLPQGSEPVHARPGRLHERDRQSLLPDGSGQPPRVPRNRRRRRGEARRRDRHELHQDDPRHRERIVHDVLTEDGEVTEDTYDWYAQDAEGNLWYLGEDTKEYENGKLKSTEGSWEAGVDGAQPGIIIPAHPKSGMAYREEYYAGQAEDGAEVLSLNARATVPVRHLRSRPPNQELHAARARSGRGEVLRPRCRSGARDHGDRRFRPHRAH